MDETVRVYQLPPRSVRLRSMLVLAPVAVVMALAMRDWWALAGLGAILAFSTVAGPVHWLVIGDGEARVLFFGRERFSTRWSDWQDVRVRSLLGWRTVSLVDAAGRTARVPAVGDVPLVRDKTFDEKVDAIRRVITPAA